MFKNHPLNTFPDIKTYNVQPQSALVQFWLAFLEIHSSNSKILSFLQEEIWEGHNTVNMWICTCILISCEMIIIFALVQKEKSAANFVQLQNDCQSPWGDSANIEQSRLREQGENTFHLKASTQGEVCGGPSIQQTVTRQSFKVMTVELLADLPQLQNEMVGEEEYDNSMQKSNL